MQTNLPGLLASTPPDKVRFQKLLADFIIANRRATVVETGSGITSLFILDAMDRAGFGKLYSIDPSPFCGYEVVNHPRYEIIKKKSFQAMAELYQRTGPWDLFLHDSDHWFECQWFEYRLGHAMLNQGGWIFADDRTWDYSTVWQEFVGEYGLDEIILGDIAGAQKKSGILINPPTSESFQAKLWNDAKSNGQAYRTKHGKRPCWTCGDDLTEWWKEPDAK